MGEMRGTKGIAMVEGSRAGLSFLRLGHNWELAEFPGGKMVILLLEFGGNNEANKRDNCQTRDSKPCLQGLFVVYASIF
ncbi:hypothetical protein VNO77_34833 [Canavalia gladiata]|uniref:Uncharacterized protein n=1 Tax=Canavalia gladiata TaxID=3824 RepID=A0AAN9KER1_CANGL